MTLGYGGERAHSKVAMGFGPEHFTRINSLLRFQNAAALTETKVG